MCLTGFVQVASEAIVAVVCSWSQSLIVQVQSALQSISVAIFFFVAYPPVQSQTLWGGERSHLFNLTSSFETRPLAFGEKHDSLGGSGVWVAPPPPTA